MRMKSWESPRRGRRRNDKSKRAAARIRQLKKQRQQLRKRIRTKPSQQQKTSGQPPEVFVLSTKLQPKNFNEQKQVALSVNESAG